MLGWDRAPSKSGEVLGVSGLALGQEGVPTAEGGLLCLVGR